MHIVKGQSLNLEINLRLFLDPSKNLGIEKGAYLHQSSQEVGAIIETNGENGMEPDRPLG
jgi:hypothetical protein